MSEKPRSRLTHMRDGGLITKELAAQLAERDCVVPSFERLTPREFRALSINDMEHEGPVRIQRRRTKGYRLPKDAVYVGRPSKWGNPFKIGDPDIGGDPMTAEDVVRRYIHLIEASARWESVKRELRGKNLACWCSLDARWCHADYLLRLANSY